MKKKIIACSVLLFAFSVSYAQSFHLGIKVGTNVNKLDGEPFSNEFTYGYHAGAFAEIGLNKKWAIEPELIFSQTNVDTSNTFSALYKFNNITAIKLNYLTLPVLMEYKVSKIVAFQAGPQFGILIQPNNSLVQNGKNAFKQGDFSMVGGVQVKLLGVRVYGRYIIGLANINGIANEDAWKNQTIQLGVGFSFL